MSEQVLQGRQFLRLHAVRNDDHDHRDDDEDQPVFREIAAHEHVFHRPH